MSKDWVADWIWGDDTEYSCSSCGWCGDIPDYVEVDYNEGAYVCPDCNTIIGI